MWIGMAAGLDSIAKPRSIPASRNDSSSMALSSLPLSYCTNVHPGRSLEEVDAGLDQYTLPVRQRYDAPLAAGLWLAAPVVKQVLAEPAQLPAFAERLLRRGLSCHTLNAFPYGDFHSRRVKENVYLPDWSDPKRLEYTIDCARILGGLLPGGAEGSISTVPLAFKGFEHPADHLERCIANLIALAVSLDRQYQESDRLIRLAIEPEPFCRLETTPETIAFFNRLRARAADAGKLEVVLRHLGMCYDVCHQAVEFEDISSSIRALTEADIRINKLHITCAIELDSPATSAAGREALAHYVEERYLHQTLARSRSGNIARLIDLTQALTANPPAEFREAESWRVHFHVPVDAERLGPLGTTRTELRQALQAVQALSYAPHLEVETYTWEVLPGDSPAGPERLINGLSRELEATRVLIQTLKS